MYKFTIVDGKQFNPDKSPFALYMHLITEAPPGTPIWVRLGKIMQGTQRINNQLEEEIEAMKSLWWEGKVIFDNDSSYVFKNLLYFYACNQSIPPALSSRYLCIQCNYDITDAKNLKTKTKTKEVTLEW